MVIFKRTIKIFVCVSVCIVIMSLMFICVYEYIDRAAQTSIVSNYSYEIDNLYVDKDCNIENAKKINAIIDKLPFNFVREFRTDWKIVIGSSIPYAFIEHENIPLDYESQGISIDGYTNWQTRIIFIREQSDVNQMFEVFIHEIGHCLDFEYGSVSYSDEFQEVYLLYCDNFVDKDVGVLNQYCTTSRDEFFANCFKEYILSPEHLQSQSPQAYIFIDNFYKDIQKTIFLYDINDIICTLRRLF